MAEKLGPTGKYPDGKFIEGDEGELNLAIGAKNGKVVVIFGTPVSWFATPPHKARELAASLVEKAEAIEKETH